MCRCESPATNGTPGTEWERHVFAPSLAEGDVLIFDEPGRCGGAGEMLGKHRSGIDSHCYHHRIVANAAMNYGAEIEAQIPEPTITSARIMRSRPRSSHAEA